MKATPTTTRTSATTWYNVKLWHIKNNESVCVKASPLCSHFLYNKYIQPTRLWESNNGKFHWEKNRTKFRRSKGNKNERETHQNTHMPKKNYAKLWNLYNLISHRAHGRTHSRFDGWQEKWKKREKNARQKRNLTFQTHQNSTVVQTVLSLFLPLFFALSFIFIILPVRHTHNYTHTHARIEKKDENLRFKLRNSSII